MKNYEKDHKPFQGFSFFREYLNKLELEKRQQENIIAELDTDLHNVKSDRNELLTR